MLLTIPLSEEAELRLKEKAAAAGVDVATYAARHLEMVAGRIRTLVDISGPIAQTFDQSGMSEDDLVDLLEQEKHEMRKAKRIR